MQKKSARRIFLCAVGKNLGCDRENLGWQGQNLGKSRQNLGGARADKWRHGAILFVPLLEKLDFLVLSTADNTHTQKHP